MEMYKKNFSPRNKLLQYDLDTFLYWRFAESEVRASLRSERSSAERFVFSFKEESKSKFARNSRLHSLSKKSNFRTKSSLWSSRKQQWDMGPSFSGLTKSGWEAPFFPEKKNFMQFWTLPLLGASLLSFLTFRNHRPDAFIKEDSLKTEMFKNLKFSQTLPASFKEKLQLNLTPSKFYSSEVPLMSYSDKTEASLNTFYGREIQNLCRFYLNFTEEKFRASASPRLALSQSEKSNEPSGELRSTRAERGSARAACGKRSLVNLEKFENLSTVSPSFEFEKNLWLKCLYLQNSLFHWNYYPLYDPNLISCLTFEPSSNQKIAFLQKLNPGFSLSFSNHEHVDKMKVVQNSIFTIDSKLNDESSLTSSVLPQSLREQPFELWKKNPTLSYLKSAQFFENWLLKLSLRVHAQAKLGDCRSVPLALNEAKAQFLEKSETLDFFYKFLRTLNQSRNTCIEAYQISKRHNTMEVSERSQERFQNVFLETFTKKYNSSIYRLMFQKQSLEMLKKQLHKSCYLEKKLEKQKPMFLQKVLKNSLLQTKKQLKPHVLDLFLLKQPDPFAKPEHKKSLESKLKAVLYDLFLLKDLKISSPCEVFLEKKQKYLESVEKINPYASKPKLQNIVKKRNVPLEIGVIEISKNQKKFIQEIQLYTQLQQIQKILLQKVSRASLRASFARSDCRSETISAAKPKLEKEKSSPLPIPRKHHISFSSEASPLLASLPLQSLSESTNLEISLTSTSNPSKTPMIVSANPFPRYLERGVREAKTNLKLFWKAKSVGQTQSLSPWEAIDLWIQSSKNELRSQKPETFKQNMRVFQPLREKRKEAVFNNKFTLHKKIDFVQKASLPQRGFETQTLRKTEKLFRSYLSIKNAKGLQNKRAASFFIKTQDGEPSLAKRDPSEALRLCRSARSEARHSTFQKNPSDIYRILRQLKDNVLFSKANPNLKLMKSKELSINPLEEEIISLDAFNSFLKNHNFQENSLELRKVHDFLFLKKANFLKNANETNLEDELKIFEKKKSLEKKRRLKKLKLENRRRKKRKRFYPRPQILRFQCYIRFLQKRYGAKPSQIKQTNVYKASCFKNKTLEGSHFLTKSPRSSLRSRSKSFRLCTQGLKYTNFYKSIYGQTVKNDSSFLSNKQATEFNLNEQNWGALQQSPSFARRARSAHAENRPISEIPHQKEFYKISNQTLTEFERLCWKSYWLRSNLKPYVLKIQKSLKRMKDIENIKTTRDISTFLQSVHQSENTFTKRHLQTTLGYVNIRENLKLIPTSFLSVLDSLSNKAEYERLLAERINDEIKNVKSQLTVDGQSQARSYKTGRQKLEKNTTKPFWNPIYEFSNNSLEPNFDTAKSMLNPEFLKTDFAKKEFPTLRLLWACQKSQLFTYQSNNLAQNLWTAYKIREQTKNNKTRKFFYRLSRNINNFKDWVDVSRVQKLKEVLETNSGPEIKNQILSLNSFLAAGASPRLSSENKKLQRLSAFKTNWATHKMQTLGGFISGKNYHTYLKSLKFQLQQNTVSKKKSLLDKESSLMPQFKDQSPWFETSMQSPIQKREFHFWWSVQKPSFPFMLSFLFSNVDDGYLYNNLANFHSSQALDASSARAEKPLRDFVKRNEGGLAFGQTELISQTFWLCACALHVGIFFALIRVPEIRSLLKFQTLIFSKLCNAYLLGIYALYDILKVYAMKIQCLIANILKVSTPDFRSFTPRSSLRSAREAQREARLAQSTQINRIKNFQSISSTKVSLQFLQNDTIQQVGIHRPYVFFSLKKQNIRKLNRTPSFALSDAQTRTKLSLSTDVALNHFFNRNWIQSTVHWNFFYKSFFQTSHKALVLREPGNNPNFGFGIKYVSSTVISPMFGKTEDSLSMLNNKQNQNPNLKNQSFFTQISESRLASLPSEVIGLRSSLSPSSSLQRPVSFVKTYNSWSTRFVWKIVLKNLEVQRFSMQKNPSGTFKPINTTQMAPRNREKSSNSKEIYSAPNESFSHSLQSNIQIQAFLTLGVLEGTRLCFSVLSFCLRIFYKIVFQVIDLLEGTLLIFYKFLEKPAEVLVDWIAEVFLVEWTSDIHTYVPEAFDTGMWASMTKLSRSTRFFYGLPLSFLLQRFILESIQIFYQWLLKPDSDLRIRQKKGTIFWDIWSEVLIQAAEKYKMNLSSLSTVKDEQELLIENLLEQKPMEKSESSINEKQDFMKRPRRGREAQAAARGERTPVPNSNVVNEDFQTSLTKLDPLMKLIQNAPTFYTPSNTGISIVPMSFLKNSIFIDQFFKQFPTQNRVHSNFLKLYLNSDASHFIEKVYSNPLKNRAVPAGAKLAKRAKAFSENHLTVPRENSLRRWSATQYLNTQGKDTDLFMDIHPPKSFAHVSFLKSYMPAQEILGSLVCEIHAGLFSSKVSKNILIVGAPGIAKSFFIQALAGETELKIVLDNAHRYAFVNGGVPVGMKLLREVFDSMALHTPCLFLLEDVHVIGERRPMLISDDETSKTKDFTFGADQEEVHEKNKLVYQLSKHSLSHYKKPYKGDFSLAIPTNHFCYDLFLGVAPPRKRRTDLTVSSPLPIQALDSTLEPSQSFESTSHGSLNEGDPFNKSGTNMSRSLGARSSASLPLLSSLQISIAQVFAPPATSPFHVLLMKEQKKLKPKKLVKDVPWSGFSYDQWMLLAKNNYSVRVKVALLADTAMKNLSVKLDMITDLLVIIDSVRSNRGFVVFATTHLPALLDPALRRPGRLDETISLPLLPNIRTRFEIFRTRLSGYTQSMDFFDWSLYSSQLKQNENELANFLDKNILSLFNSKHPQSSLSFAREARLARAKLSTRNESGASSKTHNIFNQSSFTLSTVQPFNDYPIYSLCQAFQSSLSLQSLWINPHAFKKIISRTSIENSFFLPTKSWRFPLIGARSAAEEAKPSNHVSLLFTSEIKRNYLALSYAQTGQFLTEALWLKDQSTYAMKFLGNSGFIEFSQVDKQKFMFQTLYASKFEVKQTLFKLFASKIAEFFIFQTFCPALTSVHFNSQLLKFEKTRARSEALAAGAERLPQQGLDQGRFSFPNLGDLGLDDITSSIQGRNGLLIFNNLQSSVNNWQAATAFLDGIFQKRYLYNKNSIVLKMLFLEDNVSLAQPPSPPNSSILSPARKFENYQKTLHDFIQKPGLSITQKLQMHQKQRFLKLLYKIPVSNTFSHPTTNLNSLPSNGSQSFYSSFKELGYLDLLTLRPTSTYAFYKNRFYQRQRFSFLNQWWNGQLAEHNAETTYLSHIDWRSMFVPSLGDVFLDFPDAEQYYNPRNRRWFLQSKAWSYWLNFETDMRQQISEHFLVECFTQTSELFHSNRELIDYLAYCFLRNHQLHELDLLQVLVRFYKKKDIEI